ncbi:flagellar protein export ATPase FliI [bacterium]|nr:flagellar protein export ATPase FliI [Actinomycetota bacterium]MBE32904.1 flagellar protein export ATPase FliI [bacterium]|tara:strand:+ start:12448 stop:13758 length:1311 start_codon:yes stop_codon:yes gene_type:complete
MSKLADLESYKNVIKKTNVLKVIGKVIQVVGLVVEAEVQGVSIGELCKITVTKETHILAEVVGFKEGRVLLMPLGSTAGIRPGGLIFATGRPISVKVGDALLGRVLNGLGEPMDRKGELDFDAIYGIDNDPPDPVMRPRISDVFATGVKAIDGVLTLGTGQRIGIFAGSGVGKSTLMGMLARNCSSDVNVISLIGERGREVKDFIEESLGEEGLKRSVVICATSDQPPVIRLKGALVGTAIAEYFRDQGKNVLFMMDSVTRFAMAQREIGLATGEPPTTKGYTPSVFAMLPRLMERAGTSDKGSITAIYTVLVEGGDMDEPIADAARGILDGHIALSRDLASKNHYPCIDVGHSVSRLFPVVSSDDHKKAAGRMREILARYTEAEDLINIGAYVKGSNPKIDDAISNIDAVNDFLKQGTHDTCQFDDNVKKLLSLM